MSWGKSTLFNFSKIVFRVLIQNHFAYRDQWVVRMWPYLCNIIDIKSILLSILLRHYLNVESPWRMISIFYCFKQILGRIIFILCYHFMSLLSCEVFNSLISFEMIFHKESFSLRINPFISVWTVTIHMSKTIRSTSIWKQNCDLV